jgi:NAD(P)H-hydrate epimerase
VTRIALPRLPERASDSHKGDFGRVLVIAGSRGMVGAACLTAQGALRAGAGLVRLVVPDVVWDVAAIKLTCVMTAGVPSSPEGAFGEKALDPLLEMSGWADAVALGPGLGRVESTGRLARELVMRIARPLLVDADGLFHLRPLVGESDAADRPSALASRRAPTVLTPHPGEMAHLLGSSVAAVQKSRETTAREFASHHGVTLVLKGAGTVVSDGKRVFVNSTGNPGMATGGTGDVLSGVIAALMAQRLSAFDAAVLGVYLHGLAGDLAAESIGQDAMIASDLLDHLGGAFRKHRKRNDH